MKKVAIVMSGGSGERLFPFSTPSNPKQFLTLPGMKESLLESTIRNISKVFKKDNIYIVTAKRYAEKVAELELGVNVLIEPEQRNTLGCLIWALANITCKYGDKVAIGVFPSDHIIGDRKRFRVMINDAIQASIRNHDIYLIGVEPTYPETGFGYLKYIESENYYDKSYIVEKFVEKPDIELAQKYVESREYLWNSGMILCRLDVLVAELSRNIDLWSCYGDIVHYLYLGDYDGAFDKFSDIPKISIDYGILEDSKAIIRVLKENFTWSDIGSWKRFCNSFATDENGNIIGGNPIVVDSKDSVVCSINNDIPVVVIGVEGLLVSVTDSGVLICDKNNEKGIEDAVSKLKSSGALM